VTKGFTSPSHALHARTVPTPHHTTTEVRQDDNPITMGFSAQYLHQ
jgi:hypothetical protein